MSSYGHYIGREDMADKPVDKLAIKRKEALGLAIASIHKQFGKGSIQTMNDDVIPGIEFISTGSVSLDRALGGGIAKGRVAEIYGPESVGKTTLTLSIIAECQKAGGTAAFIDAEHALDLTYAQKLGVDVSSLLISQPDSGEQALEIADTLSRSGAVDMIVIDSVAALVPRAEIEGDMGDSHMGLQARLMSQAMRKLTAISSNTCIIFINQIRMKIGVVFGNPETTTGGNALKFYSSQRIELRSPVSGIIKEGDVIIGRDIKAKIVKNKCFPPFRTAIIPLIFGKGFDKHLDLLVLASELGVIEKSGSWYSYQNEKLGQGISNAAITLENSPDLFKEIAGIVSSL